MSIYVYESNNNSMTENRFKEKYSHLLRFKREYGKPMPDTTKKDINELEKDVREYIEDVKKSRDKASKLSLGFLIAAYMSALISIGFPVVGLFVTLILCILSIIQSIKIEDYNRKLMELKEDLKRVKNRVKERKDLDRIDDCISKIDDILQGRY